jgi:hypothetical protein
MMDLPGDFLAAKGQGEHNSRPGFEVPAIPIMKGRIQHPATLAGSAH